MTAAAPALQDMALSALQESPTNPRKTWGDLAELVDSIREKGILQPILVRPIVPKPKPGWHSHEIVFGHRRFRAAKKAGLKTVPAIVRELDDRAALEAQVVENGQREDIHPLEEGLGYEQLHEKHGYTVEELAAKVGKSKSYVYQRLQLCQLVKPARKAFLEGKLAASVAVQLSRVPAELQPQALGEITQTRRVWNGGFLEDLDDWGLRDIVADPLRHEVEEFQPSDVEERPLEPKEALQVLRLRYMLSLSSATWDVTDAELVPEAGPCSTCPKRTGTQRELFPDVKSPDVCTDPTCFARKREAAMARKRSEAEAAGRKILEGKAAEEAARGRAYAKLDERCIEDPKNRTFGKLLGKRRVEEHAVLAQQKDGELVELVPRALAREVLKSSKAAAPASSSSTGNSYTSEQRKREAKAKLEKRIRGRILDQVVAKIQGLDRQDLALILSRFFDDVWNEYRRFLAARWGLVEGRGDPRSSVRAYASTLEPSELAQRLIEVALVREVMPSTWEVSRPEQLLGYAKRLGVDAAAIRREETAAARAKAKPKKKAGKKGARAKKSAARGARA